METKRPTRPKNEHQRIFFCNDCCLIRIIITAIVKYLFVHWARFSRLISKKDNHSTVLFFIPWPAMPLGATGHTFEDIYTHLNPCL